MLVEIACCPVGQLLLDAPLNCRFLTCALPAPVLQLKAAVAAVTAERDELQSMVQQAAAEMQSVQQKVEEGSSQQVRQKGGCLEAV